MEWIGENWLFILIPVLFVMMYVFGYKGRGRDYENLPVKAVSEGKRTENSHKCCD